MPQKSGRKGTHMTKMEGGSLKMKPQEDAGVGDREVVVLYSRPMGDKRHKAFLSGFGWHRPWSFPVELFKMGFSCRKGKGTCAEVFKIREL